MMIDLFGTIPSPGHDLLVKVTELKQFCLRIGCLVIDF